MALDRHRRDWEELGEQDPLWAVLTDPRKRGGRWDVDEFFATGEQELEAVLARARGWDVPARFERALDFGCGAGRVTRAMAPRFEHAIGVDVAASMVRTAERLNADRANLTFVVNDAPDLRRFDTASFDFAYSTVVLQHLPNRELALGYAEELVRVLRPRGLLVFQLPAALSLPYRLQPTRRLYALLRRLGVSEETLLRRTPLTPMRMLAVPEPVVRAAIERAGGSVLDVESLGAGDRRYFVTRDGESASSSR